MIDSRHDLQPKNQVEVLLADIRNALRNEANPEDMFIPETSARWINGLWFLSLLITLFSAIMGVLAKSWIVKYIPVTSRQDSDNAYNRWVRNKKAERWYLDKVITAIPLLIQLALLLFSLGFVLQSMGDDPELGRVILALVILGIFIYIVITVLPLLTPWTPFRTHLSDPLLNLPALCWSIILVGRSIPLLGRSIPRRFKLTPTPEDEAQTHRSWRNGPDEIDVLSEIWHTLIKSPTPSDVDEAITELTRNKLEDALWKRFVKWETPWILHERLRESIKFNGQPGSKDEIFCNHLLALSRFVDHFDHLKRSKLPVPGTLTTALGAFLDPGNPLHRWNVFPEQIRALAFSVRTPILLAWEKDYDDSEMKERPWETMVHDMLPIHRQDFAMAMCRGLVGNQERLRKVSAFSIVVCIAKGMLVLKHS